MKREDFPAQLWLMLTIVLYSTGHWIGASIALVCLCFELDEITK